MTPENFEQLLRERIQKIRSTLGMKDDEYATDDDRLHNFKMAARIDNETAVQVLWGMFKKHLVSLMDMINGIMSLSETLIDEKCGDSINYIILLEAIFKETLQRQQVKSIVCEKT